MDIPLDDRRRNAYLTVEEFCERVGISPSTYHRAVRGKVDVKTMRRIAAGLGVRPDAITEFRPVPTPELIGEITAISDRADANGWLEVDPVTLEPTGRRVFPSDV